MSPQPINLSIGVSVRVWSVLVFASLICPIRAIRSPPDGALTACGRGRLRGSTQRRIEALIRILPSVARLCGSEALSVASTGLSGCEADRECRSFSPSSYGNSVCARSACGISITTKRPLWPTVPVSRARASLLTDLRARLQNPSRRWRRAMELGLRRHVRPAGAAPLVGRRLAACRIFLQAAL